MRDHAKPFPGGLIVTFRREGEEPVMVSVPDGTGALRRAVELLLAHRGLQAGDLLTVEDID
jgi:hypothetical protein